MAATATALGRCLLYATQEALKRRVARYRITGRYVGEDIDIGLGPAVRNADHLGRDVLGDFGLQLYASPLGFDAFAIVTLTSRCVSAIVSSLVRLF